MSIALCNESEGVYLGEQKHVPQRGMEVEGRRREGVLRPYVVPIHDLCPRVIAIPLTLPLAQTISEDAGDDPSREAKRNVEDVRDGAMRMRWSGAA